MENQMNYILSLTKQGGPDPEQYEELNQWFHDLNTQVMAGALTREQTREIWQRCGEPFSVKTMQGLALNKPYGYPGDFEIIDKIYTKWHSPKPSLIKWDKFFHWQKAPIAVRNRKEYFKSLLTQIDEGHPDPSVLNVASGPCRDIFEYIRQNPSTNIRFECLDMDKRAIAYAKSLLQSLPTKPEITFYCQNAFHFRIDKKYTLVWSSGLFDYLDEEQFTFLLRSLWEMVAPGGELVIGNFSEFNPSRDYMECGEWFLHHRTESEILKLTEQAGCDLNHATIERDPTGVILLLSIRRP